MEKLIRTTESGLVRGTWDQKEKCEVYRGIPYAEPPLGELRWRPPQKKKKWKGILTADRKYPIPFQKKGYFFEENFEEIPQSEDILYLNIWTNGNGRKKPVYVWFHGGAFQGGFANDPTFKGTGFAAQDIVFVTVEYRCGAFGFLAHPELSKESEYGVSGNYGHMDQVAALQWIQRNIEYFEGDPQRVTIGGQSAGGMTVCTLMHMPQAKGLFHQAIIESGITNGSNAWKLHEAETAGVKLMEKLKCASIKEMRMVNGRRILDVSFDLEKNPLAQGVFPCVDKVYIEDDKLGDDSDIPLLLGCNGKEGITFFDSVTSEKYQLYLKKRYGRLADKIIEKYPVSTPEESLQQCIEVESLAWQAATEKYMAERCKKNHAPMYVYYFTHESKTRTGEILQPDHSGELWYVFDSLEYASWDVSEKDKTLAHIMNQYWAWFIKTGKPCGGDLPEWKAFTMEDAERMLFLEKAELKKMPFQKEIWEMFGYR